MSDVYTRPGASSIRPSAILDAIIELAQGGGGGGDGGLTPAEIQAMIDASLAAHESEADPHAIYLTQAEASSLFLPVSYVPVIPPEYVTDAELAAALGAYATTAAVTDAFTAHTGAADPHPIYLTAAEGNAAYATPASVTSSINAAIAAHEGLANPHPIYLTQAEGDGLYTPLAHASAPDPHSQYLTQAEADALYTQGGITQGQGDARYLQLTGGTLSGDLILSEATPLVSLKQVADTQPRARLTDAGLYFGPGGATVLDTSLVRTGANALSLGGSPVLTQTLGDARYATPANITSAITTHEGLSDPHPTYTTAAELSTAISNHAALSDPHPVYLTAAEGNAAYQPIGTYLTQATADLRYEPIDTMYTKAESDARYEPIDTMYTKAESDARYLQPATAASTYVPLAGGSVMTGALGPTTTNTRDLGTSSLRWRKDYLVDGDYSGSLVVAVALTVAAKAVALSPNANQTLSWLANGFFHDGPTKATYDALVARVVTLEAQVATLQAQMGAGANGHYHLLGTWRQTAKATLPSTVLEEIPA